MFYNYTCLHFFPFKLLYCRHQFPLSFNPFNSTLWRVFTGVWRMIFLLQLHYQHSRISHSLFMHWLVAGWLRPLKRSSLALINLQDQFGWDPGWRAIMAALVAFGALSGAILELICRENLFLPFPWLPRSGVGILLPAGRSCHPWHNTCFIAH